MWCGPVGSGMRGGEGGGGVTGAFGSLGALWAEQEDTGLEELHYFMAQSGVRINKKK